MPETASPRALPRAELVHHLPGRSRLRVPSRRRDLAFLTSLESRLAECPAIDEVTLNAITGSLLVEHRLELGELAEWAREHDLFALGKKTGEPSARLSRSVDGGLDRLDRLIGSLTRGEADLKSTALLFVLGALGWQVLRGQFLPSGATLVDYAMKLVAASRR